MLCDNNLPFSLASKSSFKKCLYGNCQGFFSCLLEKGKGFSYWNHF